MLGPLGGINLRLPNDCRCGKWMLEIAEITD